MSFLYDIEAYSRCRRSALVLQTQQRDFSPYVVHFTCSRTMCPVTDLVKDNGLDKQAVFNALELADQQSFDVMRAILADIQHLSLKSAHTIDNNKRKDKDKKVSLSECTLPGLLGLTQVYGRFGLVFTKTFIRSKGGRPCAYLPPEIRRNLAHTVCLYTNIYKLTDDKIQDYTHEREWIVLDELEFSLTDIAAIFVPTQEYVGRVSGLLVNNPQIPIIPLYLMYELGV